MPASLEEIESRLSGVVNMPVIDEPTARTALSELMATVAQINEAASVPSEHAVGIGGIVDRIKEWVDKLIDRMTEIVRKIGPATSFSLSVGTGLSVTVTFGPFEH